jgi:oxygen-independent coproporphyrinogen-3 oxidase
MGVTAISQLKNIYTQNIKTEKEYFDAIDKETLPVTRGYYLNEDDQIRRDVIMQIMCDFELDIPAVEKRHNIDFKKYFAWGLKNMKEMEADNLIKVTENKIEVSEMGKLLIRNIAMNFDGYIERKEDTAKYSRTV